MMDAAPFTDSSASSSSSSPQVPPLPLLPGSSLQPPLPFPVPPPPPPLPSTLTSNLTPSTSAIISRRASGPRQQRSDHTGSRSHTQPQLLTARCCALPAAALLCLLLSRPVPSPGRRVSRRVSQRQQGQAHLPQEQHQAHPRSAPRLRLPAQGQHEDTGGVQGRRRRRHDGLRCLRISRQQRPHVGRAASGSAAPAAGGRQRAGAGQRRRVQAAAAALSRQAEVK